MRYTIFKLSAFLFQKYQNFPNSTVSEEMRPGLKARHPLEMIIKNDKIDLVSHPIIKKLVDLLWDRIGKRQAVKKGIFTVLLYLCWCITALAVPANERFLYQYPADWWRVLVRD